jgi:BirA family biotin operon repressor/biotin-[acetyl-CoA-carboxylase] ligase
MSMAVPGTGSPLDLGRLATHVPGRLIWQRTVGSTNDVARSAARGGAPDGTLVVAEEQTAGRGRRSRSWDSPAGEGIYASVLLREGSWLERPALAQLGVGVAVAEALRPLVPAEVELIWPNDCYCAGAKIAGVLVEAETTGAQIELLVCGVGINVNQDAAAFPPDLRSHATSVLRVTGSATDRAALLGTVLDGIRELRRQSDVDGGAALLRRWVALSPSSQGADVQADTTEGILAGQTEGLTSAGGLRLRVDGQIREITVGELIRVRRRR